MNTSDRFKPGLTSLLLLLVSGGVGAAETSEVVYLANEGVMVASGDTKVLIDP